MSDAAFADVRRLYARDWAAVRDLRVAALRDAPDAFGGNLADSAARSPQQWQSWPGGPVFAAYMEGSPAGIAAGTVGEHWDGQPELISLWVTQLWRGYGVAGQLIAVLAEWAADIGSDWLYLKVKPHNRSAQMSYRRAGFQECAKAASYPAYTVMRLDLSRIAR